MAADEQSETVWRTVSALALSVGAGFAVAPGQLSRFYGMPDDEMTGTAAFGWRLFAVRNLVVGGAALGGSVPARQAILPVQLLDQVVFLHALATKSVPRRPALLAMATSGVIIAMCLAASAQDQQQ